MLTYEAIKDIVDIVVPPGTFNTVELEPEFAKKVRGTNVILKANSPISYEDIRRVAGDCYFQVALRISAARYTNGPSNFQWTDQEILAMMTPAGQGASLSSITRLGSFSGGIEWAVARLTSAALAKLIPLNNSSLKFMEAAKEFTLQAEEDIERIIKLIASSNTVVPEDEDNKSAKGQAYLYIAHDINPTTLPSTYFDIPDLGSIAPNLTYNNTINIEELKKVLPSPPIPATTEIETVNTFSVPVGKIGVCYFYMTGQAIIADQDLLVSRGTDQSIGQGQNSKSVSYKIEKVFKVLNNGDVKDIDDLITELSDYINSETLNALDDKNLVTNVLTAPNRGTNKLTTESVLKRELYPTTTLLKNRKASFKLYHRINSLTFDVRRYSNKASTEVLTIGFYTIDAAALTGNELALVPVNDTLNINFAASQTLRAAIKQGDLGIPGLIFGSENNYGSLSTRVPYSALLSVEKGNVAAVSIAGENSGGGTNPTDNLANSDASNTIDTFYFACTDVNVNPFTTNLVLRISSTTYSAEIPLDIVVDLTTAPFTVGPSALSIGEQVANRVVDAIYDYTRSSALTNDTKDNSNVLGVLLGDYQRVTTVINSTTGTASEIPLEHYIDGDAQIKFTGVQDISSYDKDEVAGRVQIVAFRYRKEEYRMIVDLVQVPSNLWVGTGNNILRRTQWAEGRRRSITVDTKVLTASGGVEVQTSAEELNSVKASVSNIEASKSKLLQSVFDKRKFLKDAQEGFRNKWQYPT